MRRSTFVAVAVLVLLAAYAVSASAGYAQTGSITVTVDCFGTPETTRITNNTDQTLDLSRFSLTSLDQPRPNEPFALSGTLRPGESAVFTTGQGATGNVLTEQFIYDNEAPNEGLRLNTPFGALTVLCRPGTGSLALARGVPEAGGGFSTERGPAYAWTVIGALTGAGLFLTGGGIMLRRRVH